MRIDNLKEKYTSFKNQVEELRMKLQETGEEFLVEQFKKTFEENPQLEKVTWSQYTPHFNDGEDCTFSSNHEWAEIEGYDYDSKEYKSVKEDIREFLSQFDDDLLKHMFGDHVEITVTKEGISVEEYEHE